MDINEPVEIADDIFWVGANIPDDQFQCHVYLIRNGDESILLDPGSRIRNQTYCSSARLNKETHKTHNKDDERAGLLMYSAKQLGRNRTVC